MHDAKTPAEQQSDQKTKKTNLILLALFLIVFGKVVAPTKPAVQLTRKSAASGSSQPGQSPLKIPKANKLTPQVRTPPKTSTKEKLPNAAPIEYHAYSYTNDASAFLRGMPAQRCTQWIVCHNARPSFFYNFHVRFTAFLVQAHADDPQHPGDIRAVETALGIRFFYPPATDPDGMQFARNVITFFATGGENANNDLIQLLDSFIVYRQHNPEPCSNFPLALNVELYRSPNVDIPQPLANLDVATNTHVPAKTLNTPAHKGAPPFGNHHVLCNIQKDADTYAFVLTGNTYALHRYFDLQAIAGSPGADGEGYFRIISDALADPGATANQLRQLASTLIIFLVDADADGLDVQNFLALDDQFQRK